MIRRIGERRCRRCGGKMGLSDEVRFLGKVAVTEEEWVCISCGYREYGMEGEVKK